MAYNIRESFNFGNEIIIIILCEVYNRRHKRNNRRETCLQHYNIYYIMYRETLEIVEIMWKLLL